MTESEHKFIKAELERLKNFTVQVNRELKDQKQVNCRAYMKTDNRLKNLEKKCG